MEFVEKDPNKRIRNKMVVHQQIYIGTKQNLELCFLQYFIPEEPQRIIIPCLVGDDTKPMVTYAEFCLYRAYHNNELGAFEKLKHKKDIARISALFDDFMQYSKMKGNYLDDLYTVLLERFTEERFAAAFEGLTHMKLSDVKKGIDQDRAAHGLPPVYKDGLK